MPPMTLLRTYVPILFKAVTVVFHSVFGNHHALAQALAHFAIASKIIVLYK